MLLTTNELGTYGGRALAPVEESKLQLNGESYENLLGM